jgi:hypothetical protein
MKNTFWKRAMAVIGIVALLASNAADIMPTLAEDSGTTTETAAAAADTEEGGSQLNLTDTSSDSGTAGKDQNVSSDDSTDTDSKAAAAAAADSTANDASGSSSAVESTSDSSSAAGSTSDSSAAGTSAASTADSSAAVSSAASSAAAEPSKTVYTYEDSSISVTATLTDAAAIPDDAQLVVTPVTKDSTAYNYDAYMQALNSNASAIGGASSYDENNTLLYDVAFIGNKLDANGQAIAGETQEYEPASGTVSVSVTLKQKQATEELGADSADGVKVVHLPLTDAVADSVDKTADATNISAGDVQPEVVGNVAALDTNGADQVSFTTDSMSVYAMMSVTSGTVVKTDFDVNNALGEGYGYGVVANTVNNIGTDTETNYMAGTYTASSADLGVSRNFGNVNEGGNNYFGTLGKNTTLRFKTPPANVYLGDAAWATYQSDNSVIPSDHVTGTNIELKNFDVASVITAIGANFAALKNVKDSNNNEPSVSGDNLTIDVSDKTSTPGVYVTNYSGSGIQNDKLSVGLSAGKQILVINILPTDANTFYLGRYKLNGTSSADIAADTSTNADTLCTSVIFNFGDYSGTIDSDAIGFAGIIIAPRATYKNGSGCGGILVCNDFEEAGEWHYHNHTLPGPSTTTFTIKKVWSGVTDKTILPTSIAVQLYQTVNGKSEPYGDAVNVAPNADGDFYYTWSGLLKKDSDGNAYTYSAKEISNNSAVENGGTISLNGKTYTVTYNEDGSVITNTSANTTSVKVTKVWVDGNNQDGIRPAFVTVKLLADGVDTGKTENLTATNGWKAEFTGLAKNNAGKTIEYTVAEGEVTGYTAAVTGSAAGGYTVTNTHTPETTSVKVTKAWDDGNNQDGSRPASVTVKLLADGQETGRTADLNADNSWKAEFTGLAKNNAGKAIEYTVAEGEVTGYTAAVTGSAAGGYTVTNTHTPETTSVKVTKAWDDGNNQDGVRPASVTVKLLADGQETGRTADLNADNSWKAEFTELAKNKDGKAIAYTVIENAVDGYTAAVTGSAAGGYTVTNTHTPEMTSVKVTKAWDDGNNQDGVRPASVTVKLLADGQETGRTADLNADNSWKAEFTGLAKNKDGKAIAYTVTENAVDGYTAAVTGSAADGYTVTNTHTPETTSVKVTKAWDDGNNQDGVRPAAVTVKLLADGQETGRTADLNADNSWKAEFTELAKNKDGKAIAYTVIENAVDGYTAAVTGSAAGGYTVTNTHTPEMTSVKVTKAWDDGNNQDGVRPASVTVKLLADGQETGRTADLNADNSWKAEFTGLAKNKDGKAIAYTVTENAVDGYTAAVTGSAAGGYTVTNTHTPDTTSVKVTKAWDDENNQDGIRPSTVTIHLLADEKDTGKQVTLNNDNSWTDVFDNLPVYSNGTAIKYSVKEDDVAGYTVGMTVSKVTDPKSGYSVDITNTHTVNHHSAPATGSVTVSKVNATGAAVEGAKLVIVNTDTNLEVAGTEWTTDGKDHTVSGLTPGQYAIRELSAPDGYEKADDIEFIINGDGSTTYGGETTTKAIVMIDKTSTTPTPSPTPTPKNNGSPKNGSITVSKVNASGIEIAGAQMIVTNAAGSVVASWTTAANQSYTVSDLVQGTYTLHEVSAPDGYQLAGDITFTVASDGTVTSPALSSSGKLVMLDAETPSTSSTTNNTTESTTTVSNVTTNASSTVTASTSSVRTGDTTNAMLYIILMAISASIVGIWFAVMMNRRKNSNR